MFSIHWRVPTCNQLRRGTSTKALVHREGSAGIPFSDPEQQPADVHKPRCYPHVLLSLAPFPRESRCKCFLRLTCDDANPYLRCKKITFHGFQGFFLIVLSLIGASLLPKRCPTLGPTGSPWDMWDIWGLKTDCVSPS